MSGPPHPIAPPLSIHVRGRGGLRSTSDSARTHADVPRQASQPLMQMRGRKAAHFGRSHQSAIIRPVAHQAGGIVRSAIYLGQKVFDAGLEHFVAIVPYRINDKLVFYSKPHEDCLQYDRHANISEKTAGQLGQDEVETSEDNAACSMITSVERCDWVDYPAYVPVGVQAGWPRKLSQVVADHRLEH